MGAVEAMRLMARQSAGSDISSASQTFSSWDNCMQKAYCKWPAIVGIIIGSLIILGVIGCLVSCLCCGVQCCKGCCECCSCCCPSGNGGRNSRPKYDTQPAPYYQQPPPPANMQYPPQPSAPPAAPAPPAYRGLQTATFDHSSRKADEDSLPAMPTWADATTRRVEDPSHPEEVEMDRLDNPEHDVKQPLQLHDGNVSMSGQRQARGGYQELPPHSPHSPRPPLSPQPAYHDAYSAHDGPYHQQQSYFPSEDTLPAHPNPNSRSGSASPGGMGPSPLHPSSAVSAPYGGYDNSASRRVPNFNSPRAYDRGQSPTAFAAIASGPPQRSPYQAQMASPYGDLSPPPQHSVQQPRLPALQTQQTPVHAYNAYSPTIPSSPPPPFSAGGQNGYTSYRTELDASELPANLQSGSGNPPSLLQAGPRKPIANSWRNV
jgi:hypothetical protein